MRPQEEDMGASESCLYPQTGNFTGKKVRQRIEGHHGHGLHFCIGQEVDPGMAELRDMLSFCLTISGENG